MKSIYLFSIFLLIAAGCFAQYSLNNALKNSTWYSNRNFNPFLGIEITEADSLLLTLKSIWLFKQYPNETISGKETWTFLDSLIIDYPGYPGIHRNEIFRYKYEINDKNATLKVFPENGRVIIFNIGLLISKTPYTTDRISVFVLSK